MSGIRREPTYLSREVWRALWVLARSRASENGQPMSADEMADSLLRKTIKEQWPQIFVHQKRIDELEKKLIGELQE